VSKSLGDEEVKYIQEDCLKWLQPVFVPKRISSVRNLPLNPNGKVDRNALKRIAEGVPAETKAAT